MDDLSDLIPRFDLAGMDLQLDRMDAALQQLCHPCFDIPAIQVVGTNGKGSIVRFIEAALLQAGIRCGATTSPHLISWCERIRIQGHAIETTTLRSLLIELQEISREQRLTPFELLTTAALLQFARQRVELLVLEVGLGGRLDATTAHPYRPVIAMGQIGLDHCEHLGESLTAIAHEKAAAIPVGATVISAEQHPDVRAVVDQVCRAQQARLQWVSQLPDDWVLGLNGCIQRSNAAVARGALQALAPLNWQLTDDQLRAGFAAAHWPGRLQVVSWQRQPLRLDGAHNPPAAEQLAMERCRWTDGPSRVNWILAIQRHKEALKMLDQLLQPQDRAWITPVPHHRSWTREDLIDRQPAWRDQLHAATSVEAVLEHLDNEQGTWPHPMPVVAGSLYLLGDLFARKVVAAE